MGMLYNNHNVSSQLARVGEWCQRERVSDREIEGELLFLPHGMVLYPHSTVSGCLFPSKIFSTSECRNNTEKWPHMSRPIRSKRTSSDPNNPKKLHGNKTPLHRGPLHTSHDCTQLISRTNTA